VIRNVVRSVLVVTPIFKCMLLCYFVLIFYALKSVSLLSLPVPAIKTQKTIKKFNFKHIETATCNAIYRVVQKNGATLHFPKYLENY